MSKVEQMINSTLEERNIRVGKLSDDTLLRMAGLVLQRELKDMEISAVEVANDLYDEGFELDDIIQFLQIKVDVAIRMRIR